MPVVLITGASSGIGASLARLYATPETVLILVARDPGRLETIAAECRARGATVETQSLDVRDRSATRAVLAEADARHRLDLVIVNAAINGGHPSGGVETEETAFETIDINIVGAMNVALPCVSLMSARGRGQIALMSSLAAYAPLPDAPAYSGAKAALLLHGLALREKLRPFGVKINVVTPGYVKTPMGGDYKGWRPLEMSADEAALHIRRGLARDRGVVAFPWIMFHLARGVSLLPEALRRLGMHGFRFQIRRRR